MKKMTPERVAELRVAFELASRNVGFASYSEQHAARTACIPLLGEAVLELERRLPARVKSGGPQVVLTPKPFFTYVREVVIRRWGGVTFDWDLAASHDNALCRYFFTEEDNALAQDWHKICGPTYWAWNNPPFGYLAPWVAKAHLECLLGARVVQLVKMAIGAEWFHQHVKGGPCTVIRMRGRLPFIGYGGAGANFDTMLIVWHGGEYSEEDWDWKPDLLAWLSTQHDYPLTHLLEWNWRPLQKLITERSSTIG